MRPMVQTVAVPPDSRSARALPTLHYADAYRFTVTTGPDRGANGDSAHHTAASLPRRPVGDDHGVAA